jgi:hypothetical protein
VQACVGRANESGVEGPVRCVVATGSPRGLRPLAMTPVR